MKSLKFFNRMQYGMRFSIFSLFIFLSTLAYSQDMAEVHVLRKTGFNGSAVPINFVANGEVLCKVMNKRHATLQVPAGEHAFEAKLLAKKKKKKQEPLVMELEAGETYYFQLTLKTRALDSQVDVQEITKSSANRLIPDLKPSKNCKA